MDRITYQEAIALIGSQAWPAGAQAEMRIDNLFCDTEAGGTQPKEYVLERLSKPLKGRPVRTSEKYDLRLLDGGEGITG